MLLLKECLHINFMAILLSKIIDHNVLFEGYTNELYSFLQNDLLYKWFIVIIHYYMNSNNYN